MLKTFMSIAGAVALYFLAGPALFGQDTPAATDSSRTTTTPFPTA